MRRTTLIASIVLLASAASAHADRRVAVTLGAGAAHDRYSGYHLGRSDAENRWGPGLSFDVTYRVLAELAIGVHFAVSRSHVDRHWCPGTRTDYYAVTPAVLGVAGHYTIADRVWLAPWIGVLDIETRYRHSEGQCDPFYAIDPDEVERRLAYGVGLGVDVFRDSGHRIGPFVQLARARKEIEMELHEDELEQNILITFGVAYRYW